MPDREKERHPGLSSFRSLLVDIGLFSVVGAGAVVIIIWESIRQRIETARDRYISKYFSQDNKL